MFAQLVEGGASLELRAEMDRIVHEEMLRHTNPATPAPSTSSTARPATR